MPLESLPDRFDAATHHELDGQVEGFITDNFDDVSDLSVSFHLVMLLHAIVECSNGDLDTKYLDLTHARTLINTHGELKDMLGSAWKRKSYRDIRNLAILKAPAAVLEPAAPEPITESDQAQGFSGSFQAKYRGAAIDGFYEYLTHNEKLFQKHMHNGGYYAKFCSIVQSSGTGKSRMLTELRKKDVIVIYMNLREEWDTMGFPARDPIPSSLLTNLPPTVEAYQAICYAFFIALFDTLEEYLSKHGTTPRAKEDIMCWVGKMCDMSDPPRSTSRTDFFRKLAEKYFKTRAYLDQSFPQGTGVETFSKLSERKPHPLVPPYASLVLSAAYNKVGAHLASIFPDAPYEPKLVIAIDEAHPLFRSLRGLGYRAADVICAAVNDYTYAENHAVWVVFASTTFKITNFSPPPDYKFDSARVPVYGEKLFPPYTQLGWDQGALGLGEIGMEDVSRLDHILRYGRPLWLSLKITYGRMLMHNVLFAVSSELYGARYFDSRNTSQVFAILGQRFGLNFMFGHPDSVEHLEKCVASHLRICLATTLDRNWWFTRYPSEPLLSCVAACDLHANPLNLCSALRILLSAVRSGMIDMGQRGELAGRLLWLLAKDLFIRTQAKKVVMPTTWEGHVADCQMIPVVDWLEFIFGPQTWDKNTQASVARKTFENAYLNFSHWVCMDANIAGSKEGNELSWDEWTLRHWQRTSAVQCYHQQPLIDKVIPIYFKGGPTTALPGSRMSHILISEKVQESKSSKDVLHDITRRSQYLSSDGRKYDSDSLPYIVILADFGQPASFSATFPERDVDDRCLRIYAAGVDTTTYPFLNEHPELTHTLQNLVHLQQIPETERPYTEYLNAQMRFGSTATSEHMLWEHGKDVPNVRGKSAP